MYIQYTQTTITKTFICDQTHNSNKDFKQLPRIKEVINNSQGLKYLV